MNTRLMVKMLSAMASLLFVSCTAKVYVQDRHTIMEEEAAGEWPQFDKQLLNQTAEKGPTAFRKTENNAKKKRLYQVLNGEKVSPSREVSP
jgi:hypothetical protein